MTNQRLELLKRKNKGKLLTPDLAKKLSAVLSYVVTEKDFVSLEESDHILKKCRGIKELTPKVFQFKLNDDHSDYFGYVGALLSKLDNEEVYLWMNSSHLCGLISLPAKKIFNHALDAVKLDQDDIYIIDKSLSLFIHIEFVHDEFFELSVNEQSVRTDFFEVSIRESKGFSMYQKTSKQKTAPKK